MVLCLTISRAITGMITNIMTLDIILIFISILFYVYARISHLPILMYIVAANTRVNDNNNIVVRVLNRI